MEKNSLELKDRNLEERVKELEAKLNDIEAKLNDISESLETIISPAQAMQTILGTFVKAFKDRFVK
jgi:hypothetical protein